jgi:hypothetical protein
MGQLLQAIPYTMLRAVLHSSLGLLVFYQLIFKGIYVTILRGRDPGCESTLNSVLKVCEARTLLSGGSYFRGEGK